jgi:hypothetical protein
MNDLRFTAFTTEFRDRVVDLLARCANEGLRLHPFSGLRSVTEQSELYRKGRSIGVIEESARKLRDWGASYLADSLISVGPQEGARKVTQALPGASWHQWGEALDCCIIGKDGKLVWDGDDPRYVTYGRIAIECGLEAGVFWKFKDAVHVQLQKQPVKALYQWPDIDRLMKQKFG